MTPPFPHRRPPDLPIVKGTLLPPVLDAVPPPHRTRLRDARHELGLSQQGFADLIQLAGKEMGQPNRCTKRLVQKWENGEHATISPPYREAISRVTGLNFADIYSTRDSVVFALRLSNIIKDLASVMKDVVEVLESGDRPPRETPMPQSHACPPPSRSVRGG